MGVSSTSGRLDNFFNEPTPLGQLSQPINKAAEEKKLREEEEQAKIPEKVIDPMYLFYAVLGCACFATGSILRKYQGSNVFIANSILTLSFLFLALFHFTITAIR